MKKLYESLLDDEDDLMQASDKAVISDWLKKYAVGDYKIKFTKNGLELKKGTLTIKDFKEDHFPTDFKFCHTNIKGNINIVNCDITTLEGFFDHITILNGDLHIDNCKNLTNLGTLPTIIDGNVSIFGNKSLRSLAGISEHIYGVVYIAKNGKKFKKDEIAKMVGDLVRRIDTISESFEEACETMITESEQMINEELNEPHLLKLAEFLRKQSKAKGYRSWLFSDIFGGYNIAWDKITNADVETYAWPNIDKKVITKCRNIISGAKSGFILLQNMEGEYTYIIFPNKRYIYLKSYYHQPDKRGGKSTYLAEICQDASEITLVYYEGMSTNQMKWNRMQSREGMVLNTPEYYRQVARENVKRYREIVAQNKVLKVSGADKYNNKVQDVVMRALKATTIANTQPDKFADKMYKLESLMEHIYGTKSYSNGRTYGQNGLLNVYTNYTKSISRVYNKEAYDSASTLRYIKDYTNEMDELISTIERYLSDFGV